MKCQTLSNGLVSCRVLLAQNRGGKRGSAAAHDVQNDPVRLTHAAAGHAAHVANGIVDALPDDAVAVQEFLAPAVELIAQDACINGRGNFGGTRGLGSCLLYTSDAADE